MCKKQDHLVVDKEEENIAYALTKNNSVKLLSKSSRANKSGRDRRRFRMRMRAKFVLPAVIRSNCWSNSLTEEFVYRLNEWRRDVQQLIVTWRVNASRMAGCAERRNCESLSLLNWIVSVLLIESWKCQRRSRKAERNAISGSKFAQTKNSKKEQGKNDTRRG